MAVERLKTEDQVRVVKRDDFGPGYTGDLAYGTVLAGFPCETYIDDEENKCGKPPAGTIDADIGGHFDPFAHCSEDGHDRLLKRQIEDYATSQGAPTSTGRNGFHRGHGDHFIEPNSKNE